jgi:uncharacterized surface protein with fasciclin (FAS1) repeats
LDAAKFRPHRARPPDGAARLASTRAVTSAVARHLSGMMKSALALCFLAFALLVPSAARAEAPKDIVDTAVAAGNFKTLTKALTEAGLVETLKGKGPFTVFAPTDEAFAKLPKGTVEALLKDKQKLVAVLTYHVVAGKVTAADAAKVTSAKTVNGQSLTVKAAKGHVMIDAATVTKADIMASNGVIHVIDSVLLPK